MLKEMFILAIISWFINYLKLLVNIPIEHYNEFEKRKNKINLIRLKKISKVISISLAVLIAFYIIGIHKKWFFNSAYYNIIYAHILELIVLIVFNIILRFKKKILFKDTYKGAFLLRFTMFVTILWSIFLVINAQQLHGQISVYIIVCLTFATFMLLTPVESIVVFISSYIILLIGLFNLRNNFNSFLGNVINTFFLVTLSIIIARINYKASFNKFIYQKVIEKENRTLLQSSNLLYKQIKEKDMELSETTNKLLQEINFRHDIENKSLNSFIQYEKNQKLLEKVKESEKIKTDFFTSMSHELKTPVNLIFTAQQVLETHLKQHFIDNYPLKINKFLNIIKQNCYRQLRIIDNLIDISKIDTSFFKPDLVNCTISKLVKNITYSVKEYAEFKNINLSFNTEDEDRITACDPDKIERILLNLLSNAIKFTPEGGEVIVNVLFENESVFISVKDTGIGIPKEMKEKIFMRFTQVDKAKTINKHGSGIGLSLVKSFVELLNGKIYLDSEEGEGSEFIVQLPDYTINDPEIYNIKNNDSRKELINLEFSAFNLNKNTTPLKSNNIK